MNQAMDHVPAVNKKEPRGFRHVSFIYLISALGIGPNLGSDINLFLVWSLASLPQECLSTPRLVPHASTSPALRPWFDMTRDTKFWIVRCCLKRGLIDRTSIDVYAHPHWCLR